MSTLTNILAESVAAVEIRGRPIDTHAAAKWGITKILANAELTYMAVSEWFTKEIKAFIAGKRKKELNTPAEYVMATRAGENGQGDVTMLVPRQYDFWKDPFDLNDAYSQEGGNGQMVRTRFATEEDFLGFIRIRDKQIEHDLKHANRMRRTHQRLAPIWANDPMMTYEEACEIYVRQNGVPPKEEDDE